MYNDNVNVNAKEKDRSVRFENKKNMIVINNVIELPEHCCKVTDIYKKYPEIKNRVRWLISVDKIKTWTFGKFKDLYVSSLITPESLKNHEIGVARRYNKKNVNVKPPVFFNINTGEKMVDDSDIIKLNTIFPNSKSSEYIKIYTMTRAKQITEYYVDGIKRRGIWVSKSEVLKIFPNLKIIIDEIETNVSPNIVPGTDKTKVKVSDKKTKISENNKKIELIKKIKCKYGKIGKRFLDDYKKEDQELILNGINSFKIEDYAEISAHGLKLLIVNENEAASVLNEFKTTPPKKESPPKKDKISSPKEREYYRKLLVNLEENQGRQFGRLDRIEALIRVLIDDLDIKDLDHRISVKISEIRSKRKKT